MSLRGYVKWRGMWMPPGRAAMSEHLGRHVGLDERVFHINGDYGDHRIENLRLVRVKRGSRRKYISVNGKLILAHRAVMEAHLGRKLRGDEHVHHVNENPFDNRIENLQIVSLAEHTRLHHVGKKRHPSVGAKISDRLRGRKMPEYRKVKIAKTLSGANCYKAKLTQHNVDCIRKELGSGSSMSQIARRFGVSVQTIYGIKTGKTWRFS